MASPDQPFWHRRPELGRAAKIWGAAYVLTIIASVFVA